jgi:hypothetical protein
MNDKANTELVIFEAATRRLRDAAPTLRRMASGVQFSPRAGN